MQENLGAASRIIREVDQNPQVEDAKTKELVRYISLGWGEHPHSAMEVLMVLAEIFHLRNTTWMVKEIVQKWKSSPNYNWKAGGGADHCFLLGLLASGNAGLAEKDHLAKCFPEYWLKDEYRRRRVTEFERKRALVIEARPTVADKILTDSVETEGTEKSEKNAPPKTALAN